VWTLSLVSPGSSRQFWEFSGRFFGDGMLAEFGGDRGAVPQPQQAGGQETGEFAEALVGAEGGRLVAG
jgi:hypothetical protein